MKIAVARGALFIALLAFGSEGLAGDSKAAAASAAAKEGHRLFQAGQFAKAAAKLEVAVTDASDPELLFELAVCYERLERDSEAIAEFHAYQHSPVALRVSEANQHLAALEAKQPGPAAPPEGLTKPRRVVVPTDGASGKCVNSCGKPSSPFCGNSSNRAQKACAVQFSCLRACPGAKVESGTCLKAPTTASQICLTDQ